MRRRLRRELGYFVVGVFLTLFVGGFLGWRAAHAVLGVLYFTALARLWAFLDRIERKI